MELGAQTVGGTAGPGKTQKTHVPKTNSIIMRYQKAGRGLQARDYCDQIHIKDTVVWRWGDDSVSQQLATQAGGLEFHSPAPM